MPLRLLTTKSQRRKRVKRKLPSRNQQPRLPIPKRHHRRSKGRSRKRLQHQNAKPKLHRLRQKNQRNRRSANGSAESRAKGSNAAPRLSSRLVRSVGAAGPRPIIFGGVSPGGPQAPGLLAMPPLAVAKLRLKKIAAGGCRNLQASRLRSAGTAASRQARFVGLGVLIRRSAER